MLEMGKSLGMDIGWPLSPKLMDPPTIDRNERVKFYKTKDKHVSGHYPSSRLSLKTPSCLFFKTQHFRDWILFLSSGKTYSVGPNR
jgi:hypothetical protein